MLWLRALFVHVVCCSCWLYVHHDMAGLRVTPSRAWRHSQVPSEIPICYGNYIMPAVMLYGGFLYILAQVFLKECRFDLEIVLVLVCKHMSGSLLVSVWACTCGGNAPKVLSVACMMTGRRISDGALEGALEQPLSDSRRKRTKRGECGTCATRRRGSLSFASWPPSYRRFAFQRALYRSTDKFTPALARMNYSTEDNIMLAAPIVEVGLWSTVSLLPIALRCNRLAPQGG